jgi:hypothetical protein
MRVFLIEDTMNFRMKICRKSVVNLIDQGSKMGKSALLKLHPTRLRLSSTAGISTGGGRLTALSTTTATKR